MELKKEGKIQDFKAGSQSYWIRKDENSIILSEKKQEYLDLLNSKQLKVGQIADHFSITTSSVYKHLHRLEELGLIKKIDHEWRTVGVEEKVIVL